MNKTWWVVLGLVLATLVALALRCPRLAERPMHNDEAVNALKFAPLWRGGLYKYDPSEYHGPTLPYATAALAWLTRGPAFEDFSESRLRAVTILFGLGLILLLPLLSDGLATKGMLWAALFTAVSPAMVFYSRDYIHEMLLVFFTSLTLTAAWRYWRSRKIGWALLTGAGAGLMFATKETFVITAVAAAIALGLNHLWNRLLDASAPPVRAASLRPSHVGIASAAALLVAVLLFSSFFSNPSGLLDALRTFKSYGSRGAGASEHLQGPFFYLHRLLFFHAAKGPLWSEALLFLLGLLGCAAAFIRKGLVYASPSLIRFLAIYTFALLAMYSLIPYKTPWCLLSFWHGMILLAGIGAAVLVRLARYQWARVAASALLLAGAGQLAAQAWQASTEFAADRRNPYVYAQTSPDILGLTTRVEGLKKVHPDGHRMMIKVMAAEGDYWPLPWYLRRFQQTGWYDQIPSDPYAPVMIVSAQFHAALDERKTHLMSRIFELRPGVFLELYVQKELWEAFLQKNPPKD